MGKNSLKETTDYGWNIYTIFGALDAQVFNELLHFVFATSFLQWVIRKDQNSRSQQQNLFSSLPEPHLHYNIYILRTFPPFVTAHTFCASRDIRVSVYDYVEKADFSKGMRKLGHEKKSQHVLITSVILRQSFLSAVKKIISTRTVGMCPCSHF